MRRGTRRLALITRGIGRRRETRHSVAPCIHALRVHRVVWHSPLRGGVLPADRLSLGCAVVTDTGAGLRAGGGARHKPKQCRRPAGTPRSSATAAIPTDGGLCGRVGSGSCGVVRRHNRRARSRRSQVVGVPRFPIQDCRRPSRSPPARRRALPSPDCWHSAGITATTFQSINTFRILPGPAVSKWCRSANSALVGCASHRH
jgi:hypothetical protein